MASESRALTRIARRGQGAEQAAERKRACLHALLNRPWIAKAEEPELYYTVKDHYDEFRDWFLDKTGMPLLLTRTLVKLDKTPVKAYPWMGFSEFREPRDYVFFTYGLWYLEGKTELDQFLLSDIVEEVRSGLAAAGLEGVAADWSVYSHRLSMVRALKKLRGLGVLHAVDGEEGDWAADGKSNVLFECSPHARYVLRRFPRDLTAYGSMEELSDPVPYADTQDGQSTRVRHRVFRRLLLEPVVLDSDWDEELNYVLWQRRAILDQLEGTLGWEGRRYKEGLLFFTPDLTAEADLFPTLSGVSDLALLVAGVLRRRLNEEDGGIAREANGTIRVTRAELDGVLMELQREHGAYWSKEMREASSQGLTELVLNHLTDWGLGEWEDSAHFLIRPALGRWQAKYGGDLSP